MPTNVEKQLEERAEACVVAFNRSNPSFFDFFARDATVFSANSMEQFKGREAYRAYFEPKLLADKRTMTVVSKTTQMLGDRAIIAQTCQIKQLGVVANIRQTAVWVRNDNTWEIQHLHNTLMGSPVPEKLPKTASAIRVLNERIATVAASPGVAQ